VRGLKPREITMVERGQFLFDYLNLLLTERVNEAAGFRHVAPANAPSSGPVSEHAPARGRERWVINKLRALNTWYTKGLDNGSHLRVAVNSAESVSQLRHIIEEFFFAEESMRVRALVS